ncbi:hypothetical protein BZARG_1130 [Bizionia argentinensis JUB59]|uniref:Antitoxin n=1 Tax=Bizionia argentinensis JUB59 TaxID=1046627 RepID=G2EEM8_9FLAO|nr:hypothetical protein [Bizionia argentinensis]EGV43188.1 hypothetical protein BZARG_1130 [Bizionia argentinensis JUB59]
MKAHKKRKEVLLDEQTLAMLEEKAKSQGRNLKNYMEFILTEEAAAFEPSIEYKIMMDKLIDNHNKVKSNYLSEAEFRKSTKK